MFCDFGAQCKIDALTQKPYCKCENNCKKEVFAPVCGSDNVTYVNECQLRVASCTQQVRIFIKHTGECQLTDPCLNHTCQFGSLCRPSLDGRSSECVCPEKCITYGDSRASRLICGSDGKDYPNGCELKKAACITMKNITTKYFGRCDPCKGVECPSSQLCQLDEQRNPICRCNSACSQELQPVCGSNGKTYTNECILKVESCRLQKALRVVKTGPCSVNKLLNPCTDLDCKDNEECYISPYGVSTCVCPQVCPPILKPICGTDGVTYDSECDLQRISCLNKTEVRIAHRAACGSDEHVKCQSILCDFGSQCVLDTKTGDPQCVCMFSCTEEYRPVCGSDGISYNNICQMKKESCEAKKHMSLMYKGLCGGCENKICQHYSVCETDGFGISRCVCPEDCVTFNGTVCGSDGKTYENECQLRISSCKQQKYVTITSKGKCDLCRNVHCKYGARCEDGICTCATVCPDAPEPICATDMRTYSNECEMRKFACETNVQLSIKFYGDCKDFASANEIVTKKASEGSGDEDGIIPKTCSDVKCPFGATCTDSDAKEPKCECVFNCGTDNSSDLICAEDGVFYENECSLRASSCKKRKELKVEDPERCKTSALIVNDCKTSLYGCCPDRKTSSLGPRYAGCPDKCGCNRLGSYSMSCDPITKQCSCKPGVGGLKCDRCEPGYWGLHKVHDGNSGCTHCACNKLGSVRDDCEQTTGRCVCKDGVLGMKCDHCAENEILTAHGCEFDTAAGGKRKTCQDLVCRYGATCKEDARSATCTCDFDCEDSNLISVCGSDNNTYGSECQMKLFSCRYQREIVTVRVGPCQLPMAVTPLPAPPIMMSTAGVVDTSTSNETSNTIADPNFQKLSFFGRSWTQPFLKMNKLNAFARLSLEIEFQTFSENGILLYNGQAASGYGDFVSLAISNGFVEFKFNLGSGPVVLKSHQKVELGKYIRVSAKRYYHDGKLSVAGQEDVIGRSHGSMKNLDLGDYLYVGNVPNDESKVYSNIGVKRGLFGCISKLKIGSKLTDFKTYVVKYSKTLKELYNNESAICFCEPDCDSTNHRPVCGSDSNSYESECDLHQAACRGSRPILVASIGSCSESAPYAPHVSSLIMLATAPETRSNKRHISQNLSFESLVRPKLEAVHVFSGFSYLQFPKLHATNGLSLEIEFQPFSNNAIIIYNGQSTAGKGDFVSLSMKAGFIEFRYNLGSGTALIKSRHKVKLGATVRVLAKRYLKDGKLTVSGQEDVSGESPGSMKSLDLGDHLYVGNVPGKERRVYKNVGVKKGLIGYVHKLRIGAKEVDFKSAPIKYSRSSRNAHLKSKALKRFKVLLKDGRSGRFRTND